MEYLKRGINKAASSGRPIEAIGTGLCNETFGVITNLNFIPGVGSHQSEDSKCAILKAVVLKSFLSSFKTIHSVAAGGVEPFG